MTSRTLPGIGLTGFWDAHANNWKPGMDTNLQTISALLAGGVKSRTTALPGSPTDGDIYIVPSSAGSNPNKIAVRDAGAWYYITPATGMELWVIDTGTKVRWSGTGWSPITYGSAAVHPR